MTYNEIIDLLNLSAVPFSLFFFYTGKTMTNDFPIHNLGGKARVLLSSVFGPYAQDDEYGSSTINPMELYHNQVTRAQGVFSLRMFHRSFGLMMIKENIDAPCTLLDFPDLDYFIKTIRSDYYDIIGISSIIPNVAKVRKMCELIRTHRPQATIVVGGHISNMDNIDEIIDADYIVRGDGIEWFRRYLSQDMSKPVKHPAVASAFDTKILGHNLTDKPGDTAAIVVPSVGCPMGCNFCSTSALFGGKGKFKNFFETGEELYNVMADLEGKLKVTSFFILDENFLLHRKRALALLELMKKGNKSWALFVFSSARVLSSYRMEELVGLGITWIWMGMEGQKSQYAKLAGIETVSRFETCKATASVFWVPLLSVLRNTHRKILVRSSTMRCLILLIFISSCFIPQTTAPLFTPILKPGGHCFQKRNLKSLTAMASTVSITVILISPQVRRNNYCSRLLNRTSG